MRKRAGLRRWLRAAVRVRPPAGLLAALLCLAVAGGTGADEVRSRDDSGWGPKGGQARYLPPATVPRPGAYRLGINVQNSPVGVQVVNVGSGSIGQSVGLEAGDTIVAVEGFQVGFVGERLFDLGDEIARRIA